MQGKTLILIFLSTLIGFTAVLFYFQHFAYYKRLETKNKLLVNELELEIANYSGIDSQTSGLKLRECFQVKNLDLKRLQIHDNPTPLIAPFWFNCFDAELIARDLSSNKAVAFLSKKEEFDGIDKVLALYPDGTGFQWRQLNEKYTDK